MQYALPPEEPVAACVGSMTGLYAADFKGESESNSDIKDRNQNRFDVSLHYIPKLDFAVGETLYQFRNQLVGHFLPGNLGNKGEFVVREFYPGIIGRGWNINEAFLDWRDRIHSRFQELYSKRPFELTEPETKEWRVFESQIDVNTYRNTTPLTVTQIGRVSRSRPFPEQVQWEDGQREAIRLDQMPGEFASYKFGQHFEAVVNRDPNDFQLLRVSHVRRIKPPPPLTNADREALLRGIGTSASLPNAKWD